MAVTEASLRTAVRLRLESAEPRLRPYTTALTNAAGTGTTFGVADGDAWMAGDIAETPDGEQALVISITANNLTVSRAYGGITVETLSSGDLLRKNPRFTVEQTIQEINTSLRELRGNGLYFLDTETVVYTTNKWYDVTDTDMEDVISAWYIDDDDFRVPLFAFNTDPLNDQPKVFLAAAGFTGNIFLIFKTTYSAVTELPDQVGDALVNLVAYKLLGMALAVSTTDPSRRVDRTKQGGQESRDSIWFLREFIRLRDLEVARLANQIKKVPRDIKSQRAKRFVR
jgi:hypothetical protein